MHHSVRPLTVPTFDEMDRQIEECVAVKHKGRHDHSILFYDIEMEQLDAGLPVLICFTIWNSITGFVKNINCENVYRFDDDIYPVFYIYGKECLKWFIRFLYYVPSYTKMQCNYLMGFNNMGFDDLYIVEEIQSINHTFKIKIKELMFLGTRLCRLQFKCKGGMLTSKDLMKFVSGGTSLMKLGETINLLKLKEEFDVKSFTFCHALKAVKYCARDVCITVKGWFDVGRKQFEPAVGSLIGSVGNVIQYGSQSQLAYNQVLFDVPHQYTLTNKAYQYTRQAYYGAKTDSCMFGKELLEPISVWDYKSLYPSMANAKLPIGKEKHKSHYKIDWNNFKLYDHKPFVCNIVLTKERDRNHFNQCYGVLPVHHKGNLYFVNSGTVRGIYTSVHIDAAIRDGWKVKGAKDFVFLSRWTTDYSEFYQKWFAVKESYKKDSTHYWMAKQILNSSIGYFGLKSDINNRKPLFVALFILAYTCEYHKTLKDVMSLAKVTRPLYGDTDSIFLRSKDMNKLKVVCPEMFVRSPGLGTPFTLKGDLECENLESLIVLARKLYHCHKKSGHKGHHKRDSTYANFRKALTEPVYSTKWQPNKVIKGDTVVNGKFVERKRIMRATVPELKFYCWKCRKHVTVHFRHLK